MRVCSYMDVTLLACSSETIGKLQLFCLEHGAYLFGPEALGAFYLTKTVANGTKISLKSFHKFRKVLKFRNANHSLEPKIL